MSTPRFEDLPESEQEWIDACLDGTIDANAFAALQDRMLQSPELRAVMRRSMALHNDLHEQAEGSGAVTDSWLAGESTPKNVVPLPNASGVSKFFPIAMAAGLAFLLGLALMHFGAQSRAIEHAVLPTENDPIPEASAEGFAVIANIFNAQWTTNESGRRKGDTLGAEELRLEAGVAEVQFFSGATMVIQGPARIALKSAWEASCHEGVVRMRVPPAARGFKLNGPDTEIIDLGTEFGLVVRDGKAHVEVIDGEISFKHRNGKERIVEKGGAWGLPKDGIEIESEMGKVAFPKPGNFGLQARALLQNDYARWHTHSREFARDERMIAYYTFERENSSAVVASIAEPRNAEFDGAVVLAESAAGRWPGLNQAMEFRRPGSRIRVRIPGEFEALTFATWVRIDSLDRRYNALFMGDGYETGEPHWQIRDDGKLMLSVMIDDQRPTKYPNDVAGFHHVYFSSRIWDQSMSGQWMHITSVFDPLNRRVSHYVNGKRISNEPITDENLIATLSIGNGEIGNWGQPFRETPWFAIRNLNGRIDELAILKTALTDQEVTTLYERSRAAHH
jgi:hypothetical protein